MRECLVILVYQHWGQSFKEKNEILSSYCPNYVTMSFFLFLFFWCIQKFYFSLRNALIKSFSKTKIIFRYYQTQVEFTFILFCCRKVFICLFIFFKEFEATRSNLKTSFLFSLFSLSLLSFSLFFLKTWECLDYLCEK